mgnify:CR=1 FL=1
MKRMTIVGVILCLALGTCWSAMGQVALDGKSYTGTLTSKKDGKVHEESIIFEKDMMIRSTACEAVGFKAGKYTVTEKDGVATVTGSVKNEKGEVNEIVATIKGEDLTGTLTGKTADGKTSDTMALAAKLGKPAKKAEHPAGTKHEHPSAEHPK